MSQVDIIQHAQDIAHVAMGKMNYAIKMAEKSDTSPNFKEYYTNKANNARIEFEYLMELLGNLNIEIIEVDYE